MIIANKIISNNINFCSGLNKKIQLKECVTSEQKTKKLLQNYYGVEVNFLENKSAALAIKLCLNIFLIY